MAKLLWKQVCHPSFLSHLTWELCPSSDVRLAVRSVSRPVSVAVSARGQPWSRRHPEISDSHNITPSADFPKPEISLRAVGMPNRHRLLFFACMLNGPWRTLHTKRCSVPHPSHLNRIRPDDSHGCGLDRGNSQCEGGTMTEAVRSGCWKLPRCCSGPTLGGVPAPNQRAETGGRSPHAD